MSRFLLLASLAGLSLAIPEVGAQQPTRAAALAGNWTFWRHQPNSTDFPLHVAIESQRDPVIVTGINGLQLRGVATASNLTLVGKAADKKTDITVSAHWGGDSLVGRGKQGPDSIDMLWFVRDRARPASAPTRQTVHPTEFHRVLSATVRPLAHVWSGDTVHTETVDAGGV